MATNCWGSPVNFTIRFVLSLSLLFFSPAPCFYKNIFFHDLEKKLNISEGNCVFWKTETSQSRLNSKGKEDPLLIYVFYYFQNYTNTKLSKTMLFLPVAASSGTLDYFLSLDLKSLKSGSLEVPAIDFGT